MKLSILNQKAGYDPIGDRLKSLLVRHTPKFTHLKFLMAFVTKDGLRYIKGALERYYDNGGVLEFIIGIDNGVTTYEALAYLKTRFPEASLFIFHDASPKKVFHHKIVILENEKTLSCIIGSANLTLGGMYSNYESVLFAEFDRQLDKHQVDALSETWDAYRNPRKPFDPKNLQSLTNDWLTGHGPQLRRNTRKHRKMQDGTSHRGFPTTDLPKPELSSWPRSRRSERPRREPRVHLKSRGRRLLVEVLKETGAGGTQIQIPTEALSHYFNGSVSRPIPLRLLFRTGSFRDGYIHHFANNTHRISIRELAQIPRPVILVFERLSQFESSFRCTILRGAGYIEALRDCDQQTRQGAKRWGIV